MSRTIRGNKGPGFDYGQARPTNKNYGSLYKRDGNKLVKRLTHKIERRQAEDSLRKELNARLH